MEFTVIPKNDLAELFSPEEIAEMRHSIDGKTIMIHYEKVVERLPMALSEDSEIDFPYPVYQSPNLFCPDRFSPLPFFPVSNLINQ